MKMLKIRKRNVVDAIAKAILIVLALTIIAYLYIAIFNTDVNNSTIVYQDVTITSCLCMQVCVFAIMIISNNRNYFENRKYDWLFVATLVALEMGGYDIIFCLMLH